MIAATHQTFGITFGLFAILFQQLLGFQPMGTIETIVFFCLVLLGSLLPDLDTPRSKLGRIFWPISFIISLFVKHRTATHSLLFLLIITLIGYITIFNFNLPWFYAFAIFLGTLSHIIGDWFTVRGVPLFYPLSKKRFKAPVTFRTNSYKETLILFILSITNIILFLTFLYQEAKMNIIKEIVQGLNTLLY